MNKIQLKTEQDLIKEILGGKYKEYYLIYNRKSTDETDNQKNSISYQKAENTRFAFREKLSIASISIKGLCSDGIISEKHSGFKEDDDITITDDGLVQYRIDRPKFQKMLQFMSQGYFKGIVCLSWDRISRNKGDDTLIRKLMRKGIDVRFAYATYEKTSSGALHMDIDGMFSQHHSRVTSEKVTITTRNARGKGICTYKAPIGYLNLGSMDNKPMDPERAPVIKNIFELYATGEWSLADLSKYAKEHGLVTVPMRRKRTKDEILAEEEDVVEIKQESRLLTPNNIGRMLTNPFYIGKIISSEGGHINSISHEALVSDELFDKVQSLLKKKKVSIHYVEKLDLPFRGVIRCEHCNRVYTPYEKKGITYFNSRCVTGCINTFKNFNLDFIDKKIEGVLSKLYFTENELEEIDSRIGTDISVLEDKRHKEFDNIERQKKKLREDLSYLRMNKLSLLKSGVYAPEAFVEEELSLENQIEALLSNEQVSELAMRETMKDIQKLSELIKNLIPYYNFAKPIEKDKITRIIFSELFISQNTFTYKVNSGFECFENRLRAFCDPTESRTPLNRLKTCCPNR